MGKVHLEPRCSIFRRGVEKLGRLSNQLLREGGLQDDRQAAGFELTLATEAARTGGILVADAPVLADP